MTDTRRSEVWASGETYEPYVGRWSRLVAQEFLNWLGVPAGKRWVDVGCGTGALSQAILKAASPGEVKGIDRSEGYTAYAKERVKDPRASFKLGDAQDLPLDTATYDVAVSGLVLNFVPQPNRMVAEMARVTKPGGSIGAYVWDYADRMQLMRYFWDAAVALDPAAGDLDEGVRFPICKPEPLAALFEAAGLRDVQARAVDIPTDFRDFDDYWSPFLGGQAPAPAYTMSLDMERRAALREYIRGSLPISEDGTIHLIARAWAVRGRVE